MRRREVLLVTILIVFGVLYHLSEEEGIRFFGACSSDGRFLIDSDQAQDFPQPPHHFAGISALDIRNPAGEVVVERIEGDQLVVNSTIRVSHRDKKRAEKIYARLRVKNESISGNLKVRVLSEGRFPYKRVRIFFRIGIPGNVNLDITNRYGNVHITGAGEKISANIKYGDVVVERVVSNLHLRHGYGKIQLVQVEGDLKLETAYSKLKVESAHSLVAQSKHTKMKLQGIGGGVQIKNSHNSIEMEDCGGDIEINTHHCRIGLKKILAKKLIIQNRHEDLTISQLEAESVDVALSNGDLRLHFYRVGERINLGTQYSKIILEYPVSLSPLFNINVTYGKIKNTTAVEMDLWSGKYSELSTTEEGEPEIIIANKYGDVILKNSDKLP